MVLVHNVYEGGNAAVEVFAEEPSAVSQAAEAFSAGAVAIGTIHHSAVGFDSGGWGEEQHATFGARFDGGCSAGFDNAVDGGYGGSYSCAGGEVEGECGGYEFDYGGAGWGWGEGSPAGGVGHGREGEVGVNGQGRHVYRAEAEGTDWGGREGDFAASRAAAAAAAGPEEEARNWCGSLPRDDHGLVGHHQRLAIAPAKEGLGDVGRLHAPQDGNEDVAQDPATDAGIQAILARQCVETPGFYDRMAEMTPAEELEDAESLLSSDDEQGGLGSLSGFSFRRTKAGHPLPPRTSRAMTALEVMEQRAHNSRGGSTGTTTDSSRTDSCSTDGGQGLGAAGAGVGAPWSAADVPAGGRVDETTARDIAGEARTMQLDGAIPASQPSFLGLPQTEPAPYLSLDGTDKPREEPTFERGAFEFPFLYDSTAGDNSGTATDTPGVDPRDSPALVEGRAAGLSIWNDVAPLGFGHGEADGVTGAHADGGKPSSDAVARGVSHGACRFDDGGGGGDDRAGDGEVDQAALELAADSLLGYDAPAGGGDSCGGAFLPGVANGSHGRNENNGDDDDKEAQEDEVDEAALVLAADSLLGYDAPAGGREPSRGAVVHGVAYGFHGCDDDDNDDEDEAEVDEAALALAADSLLGYDAPAFSEEVPAAAAAAATAAVAADRPSLHTTAVMSGAAMGVDDGHLPGSRVFDKRSTIGGDDDAAVAAATFAAVDEASPALSDSRFRRFRRLASSSRIFPNHGDLYQDSGVPKNDVTISDGKNDVKGAVGDAAAAANNPPALLAAENSFLDEDVADGPMCSGGGGGAWVSMDTENGEDGGAAGDGGCTNGEVAGGGQMVSGGGGGSTLEPFADGQRAAEFLATRAITQTSATDRDEDLTVRPPAEGYNESKEEVLSELVPCTNGGGGADFSDESVAFRVSQAGSGRREGPFRGVAGESGCGSHRYGPVHECDDDDEDGGTGWPVAAAEEVVHREVEDISAVPVVPAGSATALQPSDGIGEEDLPPRPQFGVADEAGVTGAAAAAAASARVIMGDFPRRTSVVGSLESPTNDSAGRNEEAAQEASLATGGGGGGLEAAGDGMESIVFQGMQPSAPVICAAVGGAELGVDVERSGGGQPGATDPAISSPLRKSWLGRAAASRAVGLLRHWLTHSAAAADNPASSGEWGPATTDTNDAGERDSASTASAGREKRLGGRSRSHPTVSPFEGDFNARVEDWRVREGHRMSRCAYGSAL